MALDDIATEVHIFKRLALLHLRARFPDVLRHGLHSFANDAEGRYAAARLAVVDPDGPHVLPAPYAERVMRSSAYVGLADDMRIDDYVDAVGRIYYDQLVNDDESAKAELGGKANGAARRGSIEATLLQDDFSTAYD
ncbi:hypothetical protein Q5752_001465 [Cryptotrichosporon argae]